MNELIIRDLYVNAEDKEILKGVSLTILSGEVHAVMGPNGAGKSTLSHVLAGKPGYTVVSGEILLNGIDLLKLSIFERAQSGIFLAMQYPIEIPGVKLDQVISASYVAAGKEIVHLPEEMEREAERINFEQKFLDRSLNTDFSGGEKKRNETLQLALLKPKFAILDELDSGLDIDALRDCARRVEQATHEFDMGVLAITHYRRLFDELKPDVVHILVDGKIQFTGGPELVEELEKDGYVNYIPVSDKQTVPASSDPFADPFL